VTTKDGQVKGKLAYMAPEQVKGVAIDRRVDVYAAGIVFWEMLTGERVFAGDNPLMLMSQVVEGVKVPPSAKVPGIPKELDAVVMKALAVDPAARYQSALEMAVDLERVVPIATTRRVGEWLGEVAKDSLDERARYVADVESRESLSDPDIQIAHEGEPATKLIPPIPASTREPGSVSRAVVTAETMTAPPAPKRPLRAAFIGVGAAVAVVLVAFFVMRTTHSVAPAVASSAPPPPTVTVAEPPPVPTATEAPAIASTTAHAPKPSPPTPVKTAPAVKAAPVKTAAAPAAAKCDPPYTVDAKGVRVPKRECF
jgi:eukaryotic-like serine/threonine-protein kinase